MNVGTDEHRERERQTWRTLAEPRELSRGKGGESKEDSQRGPRGRGWGGQGKRLGVQLARKEEAEKERRSARQKG